MQFRAPDFWGYAFLGVSDASPESPLYCVEVRGIRTKPTFARIVRFVDRSSIPKNLLAISHAVATELEASTQMVDRWNTECTILAGRTNQEKVAIQIDSATGEKFFASPGTRLRDFEECEKLWNKYVAPHLPAGD